MSVNVRRGESPYQDLARLCGDVDIVVPVGFSVFVPYHLGFLVIGLQKLAGLNLIGHQAWGTEWKENRSPLALSQHLA